MRGRATYKKHNQAPDYLYGRVDFGRFINYLMRAGDKATAEKVFYSALGEVEKKTKRNPVEVFETALENASPKVVVTSKRVGGANYQVPVEVRPERKFFLAANWIINAARAGKGRPMHLRLADEIVAAAKNEGAAIKRKVDMHKVAEANRAFASFVR